MSKARLEAFSDGVFAVAITVLIFNIQPHKTGPGGLSQALLSAWPSYAAYIASFLSIGVMWVNHHALFERLAHVDRSMVFLNLLLLMAIVFLPFATAQLGENILVAPDAKTAATLYALVALLIAALFSALWIYTLSHPQLLKPEIDWQAGFRALPRFSVGFVVYLICVPLAQFSPIAVVFLLTAVATYYMFERLPDMRRKE